MPCCASSVYLGNIADADFIDVWRSRRYRMLRQTVNTPKPLSFCANCGLRGIEVGVEESLSYCSDDSLLLGTIGLEGKKNSMSMARRVRKRLATDRWGKKVLPRLAELHRRYGAFLTRS